MKNVFYIFRESQDALGRALSGGDYSFHSDSQDNVEIAHPEIVNDLYPLVDQDVLAFNRREEDLFFGNPSF